MTTLRAYWARLGRKSTRLFGALVLAISALLLWTSPNGSTKNHVGWILLLVGMAILVWLTRKKRG